MRKNTTQTGRRHSTARDQRRKWNIKELRSSSSPPVFHIRFRQPTTSQRRVLSRYDRGHNHRTCTLSSTLRGQSVCALDLAAQWLTSRWSREHIVMCRREEIRRVREPRTTSHCEPRRTTPNHAEPPLFASSMTEEPANDSALCNFVKVRIRRTREYLHAHYTPRGAVRTVLILS